MSLLVLATAAKAQGPSWLEVAGAVLVPTVVAIITASVAIWTYVQQQRVKRCDALRDLFSEALRAVADYQELPYLVRRRSDETPMTPSEVARHASEVQTRLDFYVARLRLEARVLGEAFESLVRATRQEAGTQISDAWRQPRLASDAEMPLGAGYPRGAADEQKARCIRVMQDHLGIEGTEAP